MGKIQRLDPHLMNMIAAGEVVERPMGVVKELVENSIDAQAKNIEIHIKEGGLSEIMIIDDGVGMNAQDASMAFERHATSKIHEMNDLWKISTMGFRGEALPSIASVSHVFLKTNDGVDSTEIEIAYGKVKKAGPIGTPKGTQIIVRNLFQKTPARLKHLKTPQYEFSLISDVIQKFALARSDIAFTLTHEDRVVFESRGRGNLLEVIMEIYGRENAKLSIPIEKEDFDYMISGYALQPSVNRASKYYILLYINQRMIRSYRLQKAIIDAYAPYLPKDRFPIVILNIKMDPKLVDVNVHPSKWEVRLSKEKQLERLLFDSIAEALRGKLKVNQVERKPKERIVTKQVQFVYEETKKKENQNCYPSSLNVPPMDISREIKQEIREEFAAYQMDSKKEILEPSKENQIAKDVPVFLSKPKEEIKSNREQMNQQESKILKEEAPIKEEHSSKIIKSLNPSFPSMKVIGQLKECYLLAEGDEGLYIIDQHAAQERYHFETISKMLLNGVNDTQPLLVPLTLSVSMRGIAQIDAINELLSQIGIHLEVFGSNTVIVREIPVWMSESEEEKVIQDMIDFYLKNQEISIASLRKHAIATMACHSSIRFHRPLTLEEMQKVVDDLRCCEQPFHCPHGRPTFIEMSMKELEKEFYRVK